ncbi:hypothetical protein B296_00042739, partial [Ensete ventricosum]
AAVNLAPIAAQPPPFLALESVPRLGEKSRRPSTPEIADSPLGIAGPTACLCANFMTIAYFRETVLVRHPMG